MPGSGKALGKPPLPRNASRRSAAQMPFEIAGTPGLIRRRRAYFPAKAGSGVEPSGVPSLPVASTMATVM